MNVPKTSETSAIRRMCEKCQVKSYTWFTSTNPVGRQYQCDDCVGFVISADSPGVFGSCSMGDIRRALELLPKEKEVSVSLFQRKLKFGYTQASNVMNYLVGTGFVAPYAPPSNIQKVLLVPGVAVPTPTVSHEGEVEGLHGQYGTGMDEWDATIIDRAPAGFYHLYESVLKVWMEGKPSELNEGLIRWIKDVPGRKAMGPVSIREKLEPVGAEPEVKRFISEDIQDHYEYSVPLKSNPSGDWVTWHQHKTAMRSLRSQLSERDAEVTALTKKGENLCQEYGNSLIRIGDLERALDSLLRKVNRITATHRHGQKVSKDMLDELSNRQLEVENTLCALPPNTGVAG